MPTLVDDGVVIRESTVICEYLDEAFPAPPPKPADPAGRAAMRVWTKAVDEEVHPAIRTLTYVTTHRHILMRMSSAELEHHLASDPSPAWRERKRLWIERGYAAPDVAQAVHFLDKLFADMDEALSGSPWLVGRDYSLADGALTPYVNRIDLLGMSGIWQGRRPRLGGWFERVKARPSFEPALWKYLPADLRDEMQRDGRNGWPEVRRLLTAA